MSMELVYQGKTKNVYVVDDHHVKLVFKDTMTGKDGVFDPGENAVGLEVEGSGKAGLTLTKYFYEKMNAKGIPTHYVSADLDEPSMVVRKVTVFGKGLEVICRFKATGSFIKRFGDYIQPGTAMDAYVEVTIKDDERQDPFISKDALSLLNIMSEDEYETLKTLTQQCAEIVKEELAAKGLDLYDIKFEFGRDVETNKIILIDEISGGNMRVFKDGEMVMPMDILNYFN